MQALLITSQQSEPNANNTKTRINVTMVTTFQVSA